MRGHDQELIDKIVSMKRDLCEVYDELKRTYFLSDSDLGVVEYAYGFEGSDHDHVHEHTHIVLRMSLKIDDAVARFVFRISCFIQDIRLGDNFIEAAKYACKGGDYVWPTQLIPEPYDELKDGWRPIQRRVMELMSQQNHRGILCVVDWYGNSGKTFLSNWLSLRFKATMIPVSNDYKDLMRAVYCMNDMHYHLNWLFVDIPRSFPKRHLNQLYSAIETLKDGICWDDRYKFNMCYIDSPKICVFTNIDPELDWLSRDRWKILRMKVDGTIYEPLLEEEIRTEEDLKRKNRREYQREYMRKRRLYLKSQSKSSKEGENEELK